MLRERTQILGRQELRGLDSAGGGSAWDGQEGHLVLFFKRKITLEKRRKEDNEMPENNMPVGENYCGMRSKSRAECSKPIPRSTITASYVFLNIATRM